MYVCTYVCFFSLSSSKNCSNQNPANITYTICYLINDLYYNFHNFLTNYTITKL